MIHGLVVQDFAGAPRAFRLTLPAYFAVNDDCEGGIIGLLGRLAAAEFYVGEIASAIRALLAGGGMRAEDAAAAADKMRLADLRGAAGIVARALIAGLARDDDDEPSEGDGEAVTIGDIYSTGFAIGLKPRDLDQLTPWEFSRCVRGWNIAHGGEPELKAPKQDELAALMERYG